MINIRLLKKGNDELGLLIEGHAQKNSFKLKVLEKLFGVGNDLHCAAVSANVAMLELGITKLLKLSPTLKKKGAFSI